MINDWTGKCPLTGNPCNNDKVILAIKTVDGTTTKFAICTDCAGNFDNLIQGQENVQWRNFLETIFHGMHISQLFAPDEMKKIIVSIKNYQDLNKFISNVNPTNNPGKNKQCATCGSTVEELFSTGKVGCADCYTNLQPWIGQITSQAQAGAKKYSGKIPKNIISKKTDSLESLKEQLAAAVKDERYEEAAKLRDSIKNYNG